MLPKKFSGTNTQVGFSLIELLVVVAIIAILMALGATSYTTAQKKGRDTQRKTDLKSLQSELEKYYSDGNTYPYNTTGGTSFTCASGTVISWSGSTPVAFTCNPLASGGSSKTYLNAVPKDPQAGIGWNDYCYITTTGSPGSQNYSIYARLEITPPTSDPNTVNPAVACNSVNGYNYKVTPST